MKNHKSRKIVKARAEILRNLSAAEISQAVAGINCDTTSVTTEFPGARGTASEVTC